MSYLKSLCHFVMLATLSFVLTACGGGDTNGDSDGGTAEISSDGGSDTSTAEISSDGGSDTSTAEISSDGGSDTSTAEISSDGGSDTSSDTETSTVVSKKSKLITGYVTEEGNAKSILESGMGYYSARYTSSTNFEAYISVEQFQNNLVGTGFASSISSGNTSFRVDQSDFEPMTIGDTDRIRYNFSTDKWTVTKANSKYSYEDLVDNGDSTVVKTNRRGDEKFIVTQVLSLDGKQIADSMSELMNIYPEQQWDVQDNGLSPFGTAAFSSGAKAYNSTYVYLESDVSFGYDPTNRKVLDKTDAPFTSIEQILSLDFASFKELNAIHILFVYDYDLEDYYIFYPKNYQTGQDSGECVIYKQDSNGNWTETTDIQAEWTLVTLGGKKVFYSYGNDHTEYGALVEQDGAVYGGSYASKGLEYTTITFNKQAESDIVNAFDPSLLGSATKSIRPNTNFTINSYRRSEERFAKVKSLEK